MREREGKKTVGNGECLSQTPVHPGERSKEEEERRRRKKKEEEEERRKIEEGKTGSLESTRCTRTTP